VYTHNFVDSKDGPNINAGIDIAAAIKRVEHDAIRAPVALLDDDCVIEFLGNKNGGPAGSAEGVDHDIVSEDVEFLLFLALYVRLSREPDPTVRAQTVLLLLLFGNVGNVAAEVHKETYRLMSRAFRTFVAMNLDVTWIAVKSSVRSPVAASPRRMWSWLWFRDQTVAESVMDVILLDTYRVRVMRSTLGGSSADISWTMRMRMRGEWGRRVCVGRATQSSV